MGNPKDYTVGWICAIPTEYTAAQTFLDEKHEGPDYVSPKDTNDYTLGKMGKHNVVIAVLPNGEYGISSAASTARDMLHSFPNVRIGLMVGVGGGAPSLKHDIRLGDIVISTPGDGNGGIFQYDFGKTMQDQSFRPTGFLDQPPTVLRTACTGLKAQYEREGHRLEESINSILQGNQKLLKYRRPDPSSDKLYHSRVVHPKDQADCTACGDNPSNLVLRPNRTKDQENPAIHYGLIASANQVMKDASIRDKLAAEKDILCFEMEAAGLVNHFPCLVIRGICDYSDSHKNKEWQGYAAMAAAAYAKDLLCRIPPTEVEAERKINDILSSVGRDVHKMRGEQTRANIDRWLSPPDPSKNYNKALLQRHEGLGAWFLQGNAFKEWKTLPNSFLWLYGIPGCGKTILSSTIIKNLDDAPSFRPLIYFYFDFNDTTKQTLESMVRSLISQLFSKSPQTWQTVYSLFSSCDDGRRQPSLELLCQVFLQMIEQVKEVWIILDALDECSTRGGSSKEGLLSWMRELLRSEKRNVHLLGTSRQEQDIISRVKEFAHKDNMLPIQSNVVTDDIRVYIRTRLREDDCFQRWRDRPAVQDEIETRLMEKTDGMFRWAACQLDSLADCLDYKQLRKALNSLPETLYETYNRIIRNIPPMHKEKAIRILQFLAFSERALRIDEAVDAVAIDLEEEPHFDPSDRVPNPQEITRFCSSLVVIASPKGDSKDHDDKQLELQIAHSSVKEYLRSGQLDNDISQRFQEEAARASIARVCLAYLLHLDLNVPTKEIRKTFPLAQYCATYWMSHAAVAEGHDKTLQSFIYNFFSSKSQKICYSLHRPDLPWDNAPDRRGDSPASALYYAALGGLQSTVEYLLSRGDDVHAQGGYYGNALQAASVQGHKKVVELLLNKGVDVNAQGGRHRNALYAASVEGHEKVVELLLSKGADAGAQGERYGALYAAALEGHQKVVELLLNKGADINAQGGAYGTPLQAASYKGHEKLVELLISKGADVNAQGSIFGTALHAASYRGHQQLVQVLLSNGADVNAQGGTYGTALYAASLKGHDEVSELLLSRMTPEFGDQWRKADMGRRKELSGLLPTSRSVQPIHPQPEPSGLPLASSDAKSRPHSSKKSDILGGLRKIQVPDFLPGLGNSEKHGEKDSNSAKGHGDSSTPPDTAITITIGPVQEAIDDVLYSDRAVDDVLYFNRTDDDNSDHSDTALDDVLYSEIGVSTLIVRLKQSVASTREFASFCAARLRIEDERAKSLKRICKNTGDEILKPDGRKGSYVEGMQDMLRAYEQMAEHDAQFSVNLNHIYTELTQMADYTDRERRRIKQSGLAAEQRVQDAERQMEKAKARYDSLAQDYIHAKRSRKTSNRRFTIRGPKSTEQLEEDLYRKAKVAEEEYQAKVVNAQELRHELISTLRPNAVHFLRSLIEDIDVCLKMQMQELATQQETRLSKDEAVIVPTNKDRTKTSLRNKIAQIDNVADFRSYILGFSSEVPPQLGEIKYEQHPALSPRLTF